MKFLKLALLSAKYLYDFHSRKMLGQKCINVRQARTVKPVNISGNFLAQHRKPNYKRHQHK